VGGSSQEVEMDSLSWLGRRRGKAWRDAAQSERHRYNERLKFNRNDGGEAKTEGRRISSI